jgi:hypothetical protein
MNIGRKAVIAGFIAASLAVFLYAAPFKASWTRARPPANGFYWWRASYHPNPVLVNVYDDTDTKTRRQAYCPYFHKDYGETSFVTGDLSETAGEWLGPLKITDPPNTPIEAQAGVGPARKPRDVAY